MYFHDARLQYPVRVDNPNPVYAKMLQQAIGGVEGEIRVCLQYFFQAWGTRGPKKYRDMLLETATEEIGHIEMLATAVALNLEKAPVHLQEDGAAASPMVAAVMGGMNPRHFLSAGLAALPVNIAGDMLANATAEATGRTLACRLFEMTDDPGMKDMWRFLIARDTMHQQQWLAVIEELGGLSSQLPIPNSFPQSEENSEFSYVFLSSSVSDAAPSGRFSEGESLDGRSRFTSRKNVPLGEEPKLASPDPAGYAQKEQMTFLGGVAGAMKHMKDKILA